MINNHQNTYLEYFKVGPQLQGQSFSWTHRRACQFCTLHECSHHAFAYHHGPTVLCPHRVVVYRSLCLQLFVFFVVVSIVGPWRFRSVIDHTKTGPHRVVCPTAYGPTALSCVGAFPELILAQKVVPPRIGRLGYTRIHMRSHIETYIRTYVYIYIYIRIYTYVYIYIPRR